MPTGAISGTRKLIAAAGAAVFTLAAWAHASAAPLIAGDPARPSAITVTDGSTYGTSIYSVAIDAVCVAFVNNGPRPAKAVRFSLAFADATGTVLGVDSIYANATVPVGARSAISRSGDPFFPNGNCDKLIAHRHGAFDSSLWYRVGKSPPDHEVAAILVSAREIIYDDGTTWRSDQLPQTGDHVTIPPAPPFSAAVPAGPPVLSIRSVPGSPVELNDVNAFGASRSRDTCVTFTNHDARVAKRVNVALVLVDRTGTVAGVQTLYNKGTYSQDVKIDNSRGACAYLYQQTDGDTYYYDPKVGERLIAIGRVIAMPLLVEFADGTTWQAPNPPKIGDPVTAP